MSESFQNIIVILALAAAVSLLLWRWRRRRQRKLPCAECCSGHAAIMKARRAATKR